MNRKMNIIVLAKQVPNTTKVRMDPETNNLIRDGVESIMNPYDRSALSCAIELKERYGAVVKVLSMGPDQAKDMLYEALSAGADEACLLSDRVFAGSDTLATSYTLSAGIRYLGIPDLVICGRQAIDGDTAQVPEEIMMHLGLACATNICSVEAVEFDGAAGAGGSPEENGAGGIPKRIRLTKTSDYGELVMEMDLPGIMTVDRGCFPAVVPVISEVIAAIDKPLRVLRRGDLEAEDARLSRKGSPTRVVRVFAPEQKKAARIVRGTPEEQAAAILEAVRERMGK